MSNHFYVLIECANESWMADFWDLMDAIIGDNPLHNPAFDNHNRENLATIIRIYEANFNENALNQNAMRGRLTAASKVTPPHIDITTEITPYGTRNVYTNNQTSTFMMAYTITGGDDADYGTSHDAIRQYFLDNRIEWETYD